MIYYKSYLIISSVKSALKLVLKIIDKILNRLHLYLCLTVLTVGLLLFLLGVFSRHGEYLYGFIGALIISLLYALLRIKGEVKKKFFSKRGSAQIVPPETEETRKNKTENEDLQYSGYNNPALQNEDTGFQTEKKQEKYPKYYNVKGKPDYVMAEFSDRYELYLKTRNGLRKIREDKKVKNDGIF